MVIRMLPPRVGQTDTRRVRLSGQQGSKDPFYKSAAWGSLVRHLTKTRGKRCEGCGRAHVRLYADHIVERVDGGADLDPGNVQLLCGSCHGKKTAKARAERRFAP